MDEVIEALQGMKLTQYADQFADMGYDDLQHLQEMPPEELREIAEKMKMLEGHVKRFVQRMSAVSGAGAANAGNAASAGCAAAAAPGGGPANGAPFVAVGPTPGGGGAVVATLSQAFAVPVAGAQQWQAWAQQWQAPPAARGTPPGASGLPGGHASSCGYSLPAHVVQRATACHGGGCATEVALHWSIWSAWPTGAPGAVGMSVQVNVSPWLPSAVLETRLPAGMVAQNIWNAEIVRLDANGAVSLRLAPYPTTNFGGTFQMQNTDMCSAGRQMVRVLRGED